MDLVDFLFTVISTSTECPNPVAKGWRRNLYNDSYWSIHKLLFKTTNMAAELLLTPSINKSLLQNWHSLEFLLYCVPFWICFVDSSQVVASSLGCMLNFSDWLYAHPSSKWTHTLQDQVYQSHLSHKDPD